jgi:hypothetical protein
MYGHLDRTSDSAARSGYPTATPQRTCILVGVDICFAAGEWVICPRADRDPRHPARSETYHFIIILQIFHVHAV